MNRVVQGLPAVIGALVLAACSSPCTVPVDPDVQVRELKLVPMNVGIPAGWTSAVIDPGSSESVSISDPGLNLSLRIFVFPAASQGVVVSDYKKMGDDTVALADGLVIPADRVTGPGGAGYRVILPVADMIVEVAAMSESDQCDAALRALLRLVTPAEA